MRGGVYYEVEGAKKIPVYCTFAEAGYDYADSVALARIWGTDSEGAKRKVEDLIGYGAQWEVDYALEEAAYATPPTAEDGL